MAMYTYGNVYIQQCIHTAMYTYTFFVRKLLKYSNDGQIMLQII